MKLLNLKAEPSLKGNRIRISWINPQPGEYPEVRIVRRTTSHPESPNPAAHEGTIVFNHQEDSSILLDVNALEADYLDDHTIRYELKFVFKDKADITLSENARITIEKPGEKWIIIDNNDYYYIRLITGILRVYGFSMIEDTGLKGETVYYYTLYPYHPATSRHIFMRENRTSSLAISSYDFGKYLYDLLPGIYHQYDTQKVPEAYKKELDPRDLEKGSLQRFCEVPGSVLDKIYSMARFLLEVHNIHAIHGTLLPYLAEWIGWHTDYGTEYHRQRNEIRQAPPLYRTIGLIPAVESTVKRVTGWTCRCKEFVHNVFLSNKPERLNLWWAEQKSVGWEFFDQPLSLDFAYEGRPSIAIDNDGNAWLFFHALRGGEWQIWSKYGKDWQTQLDEDVEKCWQPDEFLYSDGLYNRHPQACLLNNLPFVAWDVYDEENALWSVKCAYYDGNKWNIYHDFFDTTIQRKNPFPVAIGNTTLWLFWHEMEQNTWKIKYKEYSLAQVIEGDGSVSGVPEQVLPDGNPFPFFGDDMFGFLHNTDNSLYLIWSEKTEVNAQGLKRHRIFYTKKLDTEITINNWEEIKEIQADGDDFHMREPVLVSHSDGTILLLYSSNKENSWNIWQRPLNEILDTKISTSLFSDRTPFPFSTGDRFFLIYRSNRSLFYKSKVYEGLITMDPRYAGSTTIDSRDNDRIWIMKKYEDTIAYTYDQGKEGKLTKKDWYTRNTLGIYINPGTEDEEELLKKIDTLYKHLDEFMPVTDRPVIIPDTGDGVKIIEYVYDYVKNGSGEGKYIESTYSDVFTSTNEETISGPLDDSEDSTE